ncbi:MAG: dihydrolipoyl dehydrogenase [Prevotella sp.]|nr:dihydrolipoyl dehydrogenase [Bacteroides sp.]MCM1366881.1 dihydrolipoyl dehydrogenase [Prevotella sp.]MCM1437165.1 dihydrolipoyl dehydrogenase [Prevotella sp.]
MHSDLIIIGAGPGGYETAVAAANRGLNVTVFEGANLGGTCLNEGCIPTKCLCRNAEMVSQFKNASEFGIDDFTFTLDYNKVVERKNEVVDKLRQGIDALFKTAKVNHIHKFVKFKDNHTVSDGENDWTADNIIIATGSTSKSLPIPGHDLECVKDSTDLLNIDYIPESLTIIGGGVIGMEFAAIFNSFGSKVTVIEFMKQILPPFDADIAKRLKQALSKKGVKIITSAAAKKIEQNEDYQIVVTYESKGKEEQVTSSDLLMAVGRTPRLNDLNLEAAGVQYSPKGIVVDDNMQTSAQNVYAIGDVNARMMLAHVASFQGLRAINHIQGQQDDIRFDIVPSAVFTVPECGMVGMTEEQCKANGIDTLIGQSFFRANGKSLAMGEPDGLVKLIFRKDSGLLIGAHIMGIEACDLAQQCADLMNRQTTLTQMRQIIFSHPSVSEVLLAATHSVK